MELLDIVLLSIAVVAAVAAIAVAFVIQSRSAAERERLVRNYEYEKDQLQDQIAALKEEKASVESRLAASAEYDQKMRQAQEEQHRRDLEQMKAAFENLSNRNSEAFKARSAESIAQLLAPVQEKFREFAQSVRDSQKESMERHSRLEQKIEDLDRQSRSVGDEARNLANALTGYSKVQGDFGEMLLADVLKNAGLMEGIHFVTQGVMTDEAGREIKTADGRTMIPDVMVFYPDDTAVIIDSKVSLNAYSAYMAADTVEERVRQAKAHVESVKSHVNELRGKDYASYLAEGKQKVDYNIMFIPIEGAFRLMLEEDPRLWQVAKDNNVLIVSQMTLVIVLNMIQMSWRQHDQEKNINAVYATVSELMTQIGAWLASFEDLGESLDKASRNYTQAKMKLVESNQSVIRKIKKLESLGASPRKSRARINTGSRLVSGPSSVVPASLDAKPGEYEND